MAFEVSQFSNKGLELLGQLSSHKSLVVKNILAAETAYTAADFEQNIAWWTQETAATMAKVNASLSSAGHDKDQARLTIKFTAKPGHQDNIGIKTVIVIACGKESGVETDDIVYCGVSDPQGITVLGYKEGGVDVSTAVSLYFKFNAASSITLETNENPDFVLHSEMDRFLSCHKVGDVTTGEDQDVKGNKYFQNGIMLNGQDGRSCIQFTDTYSRQDIACTVSVSPQDHGLGISYGSHLFTDNDCLLGMDLDDGTNLYELTKQRVSYHVPDLYVDNVTTNSIAVEAGEDITLYANITPYDDTKSIGTTAKPFNNIYATNLNATDVNAGVVYATNSISTNNLYSNTLSHEKATTGSSGTTRETFTTSYNKIQYSMTHGVQVGYSTMWMGDDTIGFTAGPHGNEYADDYTLMTMSIREIQVRRPVTLFNDITIPAAKVSIENGYQIVTGIPLPQREQHAAPDTNKFDAIGIHIGCLVGAYDTVEKFTGSSAIKYLHPGTRIVVKKGRIHLAMCAGAVNESAVNSWYPCGHNVNYSSPTGIEDLYLPEGQYVSCTGAVAQQNTTEYVFVLLLRVA